MFLASYDKFLDSGGQSAYGTDSEDDQEGEMHESGGPPRRKRRRAVVAVAGIAAAALLAASAAWACTAQMSPLTVCKAGTNCVTSAFPGTKIRASNRGAVPPLKPAASYHLKFNNANRTRNLQSCHSSPYIMKSSVPTDTMGVLDVHAYLPNANSAPRGLSQVCGVESSPTPGATATTHAQFTIL